MDLSKSCGSKRLAYNSFLTKHKCRVDQSAYAVIGKLIMILNLPMGFKINPDNENTQLIRT